MPLTSALPTTVCRERSMFMSRRTSSTRAARCALDHDLGSMSSEAYESVSSQVRCADMRSSWST
jgi:hypothetical protein